MTEKLVSHFEPDNKSFRSFSLEVERIAHERPLDVAIRISSKAGLQVVTYGQLDSEANRLARLLQRIGVIPGDLVGVQAEDRQIVAVTALAVAKTGAALLPTDPGLPRSRLSDVINKGRVNVLLTEQPARYAEIGTALVYSWDQVERATSKLSNAPLAGVASHDQNLCYAISTSGTSGSGGKLVGVTYANAISHLQGFIETYSLTAADRVAWILPPYFDVGLNEFWSTLAVGAELQVFDSSIAADGVAMWEALDAGGITLVQLTASLWDRLPRRSLPRLRVAVSGGSVPSVNSIEHWARGRMFFNAYGPTETTVTASTQLLSPSGLPTLGEPLPGVEFRVDLSAASDGGEASTHGELLIAGPGVTRGYLGQPRETARLFRPDPMGAPGSRLFRTGDCVAPMDTSGMRFLGRFDEQVKVNGTRIDLQETEIAIRQTPGVESAVVLLTDEVPPRIICFVSPASVTPEACHRRAVAILPSAAVPSRIVPLDEIPLGHTGKPDLAKLKRMAREGPVLPVGRSAPGDPVEDFLCACWSELLGIGPAGMAQSWLHAGGDSLGLQRMRSRIRQVLGVTLTSEELFVLPSIEGMRSAIVGRLLNSNPTNRSDTISEQFLFEQLSVEDRAALRLRLEAPEEGFVAPPHISWSDGSSVAPMSPGQERMWFVQESFANRSTFNVVSACEIHGDVDLSALKTALGQLIERHSPLRTSLTVLGSEYQQRIRPYSQCEISFREFLIPELIDHKVHEWLLTQSSEPFELDADVLIRLGILSTPDNQHILLLTAHHAAVDGWSIGVLHRDFSHFYAAALGKEPSDLPVIRPYTAFSASQNAHRVSDEYATRTQQLRRELNRHLGQAVPGDTLGSPGQQGVTAIRHLSDDLRRLAEQAADDHDTTSFVVFMTVAAIALHRLFDVDMNVLGVPVAGRQDIQDENAIGYYSNTMLFPVNFAERATIGYCVDQLAQYSRFAQDYQDIALQDLQAEGNNSADGRQPFSVLFAYQNAPYMPLQLVGTTTKDLYFPTPVAHAGLTINIWSRKGLEIELEGDFRRFSKAGLETIASAMECALRVIADNALPVARIPFTAIDPTDLEIPRTSSTSQPIDTAAPMTEVTEVTERPDVLELWASLLDRTDLTMSSNFFSLGGHSLLAAKLIAQVRQRYNVNVPLRSFLKDPTPAGLARFLQ